MTFYMLLRIINETKAQFKFSESNCFVFGCTFQNKS